MVKENKSFWITNISNVNVSLTDLGITINAKSSVDLLGRRYDLSEDLLENSLSSGSLYKKRDKLIKRIVPPQIKQDPILDLKKDAVFSNRSKSSVYAEEIKHEELDIPDVEYANDNSDTTEQDRLGRYSK